MLKNDADYGHSNWVSHARDLQLRFEIEQSDTRAIIKTKVISHFQSPVLDSLKEHLTENTILNLYAIFKTTYKFEPYLYYIPDFTVRSIIAKLRKSAHNFQIETGRFSKNTTPREERFCPYCKTLNIFTVESEIFLLSCPFLTKKDINF